MAGFKLVFVVNHNMVTNRPNGHCILAVVVMNLVAVSRDLDLVWFAGRDAHLNIDARLAACILVSRIGNLNDRGNGAGSDVSLSAIFHVLVDLNRRPGNHIPGRRGNGGLNRIWTRSVLVQRGLVEWGITGVGNWR